MGPGDACQMAFNFGHGTSSTTATYVAEWLMHAVLPSHPNVNRFLGEFVSSVPDDMFGALNPLQRELGTLHAAAVCAV
jgi:hypothetical protein